MSKDGGSAFPEVLTDFEYSSSASELKGNTYSVGGMSLRDYFAAAALPLVAAAWNDTPREEGVTAGQHAAAVAYAIAERMLEERK